MHSRSTSRVLWSAVILAALGLGGGCPDETPILYVDVVTDLVPAVEFVSLTVEVAAERAVFTPGRTDLFGRGVRVASLGGLEAGSFDGVVRLTSPEGTTLVERPFLVEIEAGQQTATIVISRTCRSVSCPTAANPSATTCLGDICVDPRCTPERPEFCPAPSCVTGDQCATGAACAEPSCTGGVCLLTARSGACGADEYCDPTQGCRFAPGADAGSDIGMDAGPADAGRDAPPIDCECTPGVRGRFSCGRGCGRIARLCRDDCQWEDDGACIEEESTCWLWSSIGGGWAPYSEPTAAAAPPVSAVLAAFDVEAMGEAYVLTATTYHILTLADRTWATSGTLTSLLPGMSGTPMYAVSIPAFYEGPGATGRERALITTTAGQTYAFDHTTGTRRWTARAFTPCCEEPSWTAASAPSFLDVQAAWFASNNTRTLYVTDDGPLCAAAEGAGSAFAYQALLAPPSLHYLESTHCLAFAPPRDATDREPFGGTRFGGSVGRNPNPSRVQAMFFHEVDRSIWAFTL